MCKSFLIMVVAICALSFFFAAAAKKNMEAYQASNIVALEKALNQ